MTSAQALGIFIIIFLMVMGILTVIGLFVDKKEKIGILHVLYTNGNLSWYAELYEGHNPEELLNLKNVSFKIQVDKEI